MSIPTESYTLITEHEGYLKRLNDGTDRVVPYRCPAGVPTIGYGSTRYFPGEQRVTMADPPISKARALECIAGELRTNETAVDSMTTSKLHPLMRGAVVSFCYNCGNGAYRASTLRRKINERRWDEVPGEFAKWRSGGGRILPGLVRRRREEAAMFMRGVALLKAGDSTYEEAPQNQPAPSAPAQVPTSTRSRWRDFTDWFFGKGVFHNVVAQ